MEYILYYVFDSIKADNGSRIPIDIFSYNTALKNMRLACEARTDEELTMFIEDYYWAKKGTHYFRNFEGIDSKLKVKLSNILNKDEENRVQRHVDVTEIGGSAERRPRTYISYLPPP